MTIRLLIADDHPVVRSGLASLLADTDIEVVAQASSGDEAIRLAKKHNPDVVLLDVRMPDGEGLASLSRIQVKQPDIPVLMFSACDNPEFAAKSLALGAAGYARKSSNRRRSAADLLLVEWAKEWLLEE